MLRAFVLLGGCCCATVMLAGCTTEPPAGNVTLKPTPRLAPAEPWSVACIDPNAVEPAWISNGSIGARIGRDGLVVRFLRASDQEGSGEERLIAGRIADPFSIRVGDTEMKLDPSHPYVQRFDFKTLTLTTRFGSTIGPVEVITYAIPGEEVLRQEWTLDLGPNVSVSVTGAAKSSKILRGNILTVRRCYPAGPTTNWKLPRMQPAADIEIDGPVEDQQAVRSFIAYLRMAIPPTTPTRSGPLSPTGLSADFYKGHVFWDADVWMLPALAMLDPERARSIPAFRLDRHSAAQASFRSWWTERARSGVPQTGAAKFPWESGTSGKETMLGMFREEVHINGSVLWGLDIADRLGLAEASEVAKVEASCRAFWQSMITPRPETQEYDIKSVLGVDEFRYTDNDLVTNILAQWTLNGRSHTRPANAPTLHLPRDESTFTTYEGDRQGTFKQAAAVLSVFPFQFPPAEREAQAMMSRYASKIDARGPAMTEAIHATIHARHGDVEAGYREWRRGWGEFAAQRPLLLFSENRQRDRTYFVTGAAGCLQSVLYGFLGFRIDYSPDPEARWSKRLRRGWLSVKPNLPLAWKKAVVRNLRLLDRSYTFTITRSGVQVQEGD